MHLSAKLILMCLISLFEPRVTFTQNYSTSQESVHKLRRKTDCMVRFQIPGIGSKYSKLPFGGAKQASFPFSAVSTESRHSSMSNPGTAIVS